MKLLIKNRVCPRCILAVEHSLRAAGLEHRGIRLGEVELTVASLAEELGCTADYLSHLYSRSTGEHLWQVILRQRLARAARLLAENDSAVKEIAWCSGFASASYFIRSFKQQFGVTPKVFRTQMQAGVS